MVVRYIIPCIMFFVLICNTLCMSMQQNTINFELAPELQKYILELYPNLQRQHIHPKLCECQFFWLTKDSNKENLDLVRFNNYAYLQHPSMVAKIPAQALEFLVLLPTQYGKKGFYFTIDDLPILQAHTNYVIDLKIIDRNSKIPFFIITIDGTPEFFEERMTFPYESKQTQQTQSVNLTQPLLLQDDPFGEDYEWKKYIEDDTNPLRFQLSTNLQKYYAFNQQRLQALGTWPPRIIAYNQNTYKEEQYDFDPLDSTVYLSAGITTLCVILPFLSWVLKRKLIYPDTPAILQDHILQIHYIAEKEDIDILYDPVDSNGFF